MIQTQQNTFVLFTLFKLTLDERKTLTKISTCKPLTTIPQTSARFGHEGTRKPANHNLWQKAVCRGKPKGKPHNPPKAQEADETYTYDSPNNYYHNDNYTAPSQNRGHRPFNGQGSNQQFRGFTQRHRGQRPQYNQRQFQNYQISERCISTEPYSIRQQLQTLFSGKSSK